MGENHYKTARNHEKRKSHDLEDVLICLFHTYNIAFSGLFLFM